MTCCICMATDNLFKVKCCNQLFHVLCLEEWLKRWKFSCPMCRNVEQFMGSLPCMREALTDGLDHMYRHGFRLYTQRSDIICGRIIIRNRPRFLLRLLRSNSKQGFFFDFRGTKIWIDVEYCPETDGNLRYRLKIVE